MIVVSVVVVWRSGGSDRMGWDVSEPPNDSINRTFLTRIADPSSVGLGTRQQYSTFLLLTPLYGRFFFCEKEYDLLLAILTGVLGISLDDVFVLFEETIP
mmetsp:Transcript_22915/g.40249  ORF Transcript_22915/g.40249 Transcript_22915/m.40249 type:complete len:100 (-) Transcript_22915:269-568(-)